MWRLALAAALVVVLALALAFAVASQTDSPAATPEGSASPAPPSLESPAPTVGPSGPTAGQPRPPVIDPAYPGTLRPGDWVMITGTASCLNMRFDPRMPPVVSDNTTYDNVLNCLPDGFVGRLAADGWMGSPSVPVHTDGRWWWQIVGQGWAAEEFLTFDHYGGLPFPERPDLASAGLIAYMRPDHGLWLMNADGSNHRQVAAGGTDAGGLNEYIEAFQWSPLGDQLAVGLRNQGGATVTRIIDLAGRLLIEVNGLGQPRWSPDGRRLSGIRTVPLVGAYQATPLRLRCRHEPRLACWAAHLRLHGFRVEPRRRVTRIPVRFGPYRPAGWHGRRCRERELSRRWSACRLRGRLQRAHPATYHS